MRIKWIAAQLGLEKILMKKGKFVGYFIADQESKFYQSANFTKILQFVQAHPRDFQLKEKNTRKGLRLLLVFEKATSVEKVLHVLKKVFEGNQVV